jgi:glycerol-3-phosphate acyltransferase PlsY
LITIDSNLVLSAVICYLIGSIPIGYLVVKYACGKDITKEGSGNVGTMNTFKVSGSGKFTVIVFIMDFLKGFLPVLFLSYYLHSNIFSIFVSSVFIVIGHNYSIWLKFKGGRGLAAAAGIFAVINYPLLITWCILWFVLFFLKRGVLFSNFFATLILPFIAVLIKKFYISFTFPFMNGNYYGYFILYIAILVILILSKHWVVISRMIPSEAKSFNK